MQLIVKSKYFALRKLEGFSGRLYSFQYVPEDEDGYWPEPVFDQFLHKYDNLATLTSIFKDCETQFKEKGHNYELAAKKCFTEVQKLKTNLVQYAKLGDFTPLIKDTHLGKFKKGDDHKKNKSVTKGPLITIYSSNKKDHNTNLKNDVIEFRLSYLRLYGFFFNKGLIVILGGCVKFDEKIQQSSYNTRVLEEVEMIESLITRTNTQNQNEITITLMKQEDYFSY